MAIIDKHKISGGIAQFCTDMLAVFHATQYRIRVAQQLVGLADSSFGHQLADDRTTNFTLLRQLKHLDAQLLTVAHIVVKTFCAIVTKAVVVASQQHLHTQSVAQLLLHKFASGHLLQGIVERQYLNAVDARLRQQ